MIVRFFRIPERRGDPLPLPAYMSAEAAGIDLRADEAFEIAPLGRALVPTGFGVELPPGTEGQVRPRSGLAVKHGVTLLNSPGTIDSDYRGEVRVALVNLSDTPFRAERGERIAQLVIAPIVRVEIREVAEGTPTARGGGGFGSTGR